MFDPRVHLSVGGRPSTTCHSYASLVDTVEYPCIGIMVVSGLCRVDRTEGALALEKDLAAILKMARAEKGRLL